MIPGTTIFNGTTKSSQPYSIRYIGKDDAPALCNYINTLSDEHTFIRFQGEHMALPDEEAYVEKQLNKVADGTTVQLLAFIGNDLAGVCQVDRMDKIERHIANLGLTVAKPYRKDGIGSKLLDLALQEASKHMAGLRIITLGVFANNAVALRLYERFGFREYGKIPNGIMQDGNYLDHVFMYKTLT